MMMGLMQPKAGCQMSLTGKIECSILIEAPRERVWQMLTDGAQLEACLSEYREFTAVRVGAAVKFGPEADAVYAIIMVLDAPQELILHHPPQPQYYAVPIHTRYILEDADGGTCLAVVESGYDGLPEDIRDQRIAAAYEGYTWTLAKVKDYLERG